LRVTNYTTGRYTVFYNLTPPEGIRTSYFNTFYYPSPAFHFTHRFHRWQSTVSGARNTPIV